MRAGAVLAAAIVSVAGGCVGAVGDGPSGLLRIGDAGGSARDGAAAGPSVDASLSDGDAAAPGSDAASTRADAAPAPSDGGPTCGPCPAEARCEGAPARCVCPPGFVLNGPSCVADVPGNPALHTREEVCAAWAAAQAEVAPNGGFSKSDAMCDPGTVSREGLDDALRRVNFHRWLAGIGPTLEEPANHARAQACALISAWNPAGQQAHSPPASATCYSPEGAGAAGSSNIAWGNVTAANAIDQWMVDRSNETTFGHRRWLLNPPLSGVGIGAYQGGNNYGSASCIIVFGSGGSATGPETIAYPPPGFVPADIAQWGWTLQGRVPQRNLTVTVTAQSSGMAMPATVTALIGNYGGSSGLFIDRDGWRPVAGETYQIEVTGDGVAPIRYTITPVDCP